MPGPVSRTNTWNEPLLASALERGPDLGSSPSPEPPVRGRGQYFPNQIVALRRQLRSRNVSWSFRFSLSFAAPVQPPVVIATRARPHNCRRFRRLCSLHEQGGPL